MLQNFRTWQEWRGRHKPLAARGWTVAVAAQHPRNPERTRESVPPREWSQDEIDDDLGLPFICPVTCQPCTTEQDEFCEDYGCARKAGIDVDRDIV